MNPLEQSQATGKVYPEGESATILDLGTTEASTEIADSLGVEVGSEVIFRRRTHHARDHALSHGTSWFPGHLKETAPKLLEIGRIPEGSFVYAGDANGTPVTAWEQTESEGSANAEEAHRLGISEGQPVTRLRTWAKDDEGTVIEYGETTHI